MMEHGLATPKHVPTAAVVGTMLQSHHARQDPPGKMRGKLSRYGLILSFRQNLNSFCFSITMLYNCI
jgi:hypothetical protein